MTNSIKKRVLRYTSLVLIPILLIALLCSCAEEPEEAVLPEKWTGIPDFSDVSITCIGDSITAGAYIEHGYPEALASILGVKQNTTLGIWGSTVSNLEGKSSTPYVDRYSEIPKDTGIILIQTQCNDVGRIPIGDNDDTEPDTYKGALNYLIPHIVEDYPSAYVFMVGPNSNANRSDMEPYAVAIRDITAIHGIDLLEMFDGNSNYIPAMDTVDGLHHTQVYVDNVLAPWIARFILINGPFQ